MDTVMPAQEVVKAPLTKVQVLVMKYQNELDQVKQQLQQIDQETARLQKSRDQILTKGIELQGALKALAEAGE